MLSSKVSQGESVSERSKVSLIYTCLWVDEVKVAALLGSVAGAVAGASGTVGWARTPPDHNPAGTALPRTEGVGWRRKRRGGERERTGWGGR